MAKIKVPKLINCSCCHKNLDSKMNFYNNSNKYMREFNYGKHLYCKDCCLEISQKIMQEHCRINRKPDKFGYEIGMRYICSFFNIPYIQDVVNVLYEKEENTKRNINYVFQYQNVMKDLGYDKSEYWDALGGNSLLSMNLIKDKDTKPNSDGDLKLFVDLKARWGTQDSLDDYIYLEEEYSKYAKGEILSNFIENTIRRLCLAELDLRKLREQNAEQGDIKKAEDRIQTYGKTLKIDDYKPSSSQSAGEKSIFNWIEITERERPIDENLDKHFGEDISKIRDDYDHILRCTKNIVANTKEYPDLTIDED